MAIGFQGKVRRSYPVEGTRVIILADGYVGDVEVGEWVEVELAAGGKGTAQVSSVAWGSAFHADNPPLTLVLRKLQGEIETGAEVRGIRKPAEE